MSQPTERLDTPPKPGRWSVLATCTLMAACFSAKKQSAEPPVVDAGPVLSCDERHSMAGDLLRKAAAEADRSCSSEADCQAVLGAASCHAHCQYALVSASGRAEIERVQRSVEADLCASDASDACIHTSPSCIDPPPARCELGQCEPDVNEPLRCTQLRAAAARGYMQALDEADKSCTLDADCEVVATAVNCYDYCEHTAALAAGGRDAFQAAVAGINRGECSEYTVLGCSTPLAHACQPVDAGDVACVAGTCRRGPNPDSLPDCVTCAEQSLEWGLFGGLFPDVITSRLDPCVRYTRTRTLKRDFSVVTVCEDDLVVCDGAISGIGVAAALADAQVREAFEGELEFFGVDATAGDGQVLMIRSGTQRLFVGPPCVDDRPNCRAIPRGVQTLADLLQQIDLVEDRGACAAFGRQ